MKVTKNQVYVGMIAAAAAAWCVDRFVLGGGITEPQRAGAMAVAAPAVAGGSAGAPMAAVDAGAPRTVGAPKTLAERFAGAEGRVERDAFAAPEGWAAAVSAPVAAAEPAREEAPVFDGEAFRKEHKLTAVIRMGKMGGAALVDGKMVEVGGTFMGLRLKELTQTTATFEGAGGEVVLRAEEPGAKSVEGRGGLNGG